MGKWPETVNKNAFPKTRVLAHIYMGLCLVSVLLLLLGTNLWHYIPGVCVPAWSCYMLNEDIVYISVLFPVFGLMVLPLLIIASYIVLIAAKKPAVFLVACWLDVMMRAYITAYLISNNSEIAGFVFWCIGLALNVALAMLITVAASCENTPAAPAKKQD